MRKTTIPAIKPHHQEIVLREDLSELCGDTIEALILGLIDSWTSNSSKYKDGGIVYVTTNAADISNQIKSQSATTIQRKLNSLIEKRFLLIEKDPISTSPKARLYAINAPLISEKFRELYANF